MIKVKEEQRIVTENNAKGDVSLFIRHLTDFDQKNPKLRTFAIASLKPNEEVPLHLHTGETEYYYILSGKGLYNDDGKLIEVGPGVITHTPSGKSHGIKNLGDEMLEFVALIILD